MEAGETSSGRNPALPRMGVSETLLPPNADDPGDEGSRGLHLRDAERDAERERHRSSIVGPLSSDVFIYLVVCPA